MLVASWQRGLIFETRCCFFLLSLHTGQRKRLYRNDAAQRNPTNIINQKGAEESAERNKKGLRKQGAMEQTAKEQGNPHFAPLVKKSTGGKGGVCLRLLEELEMDETFSSSSRVLHGSSTHLPSASPRAPSSCRVLLTFSFSVLSLSFSSLRQSHGVSESVRTSTKTYRCSATEAPCCLPSSRAALSLSRTAEKSSMSVSSSPPHQYFERILRFLRVGIGRAVICSTFDRIDSHCALNALGSS